MTEIFKLANKSVLIDSKLIYLYRKAELLRKMYYGGYEDFDGANGGTWKKYINIPITTVPLKSAVYRVEISSTDASVVSPYEQVKVSSSISSEFWNLVRSDGYDIRPFDDLFNQLYFWVEKFDYDNQSAIIWIRLPANSKELNIAFGNEQAYDSVYHDPDNVFLFFEDFMTDPNTNDKWEIYRSSNDSSNEFVYDSTRKRVYLTKAVFYKGCFAFFKDVQLPDTFRLITYGGGGGGNGADGWAFGFFKDIEPYRTYGRSTSGGSFGLGAYNGSSRYISKGYAIEFDNYQNDLDPSANHNALVDTFNTVDPEKHYCRKDTNVANEDNATHKIDIRVNSELVELYVDGTLHFSCSVTLDRTYKYAGFGAGTGGKDNNHWIQTYVLLFELIDPASFDTPRIVMF